ncbi:hypothetical protein XU18_2986 [Perkinsela sp. CCAP 1560/4]|nr:hypothetical protein XU18_2986 [Perkinsela sp. CCAP 1560/4]|eukprot:KNH06118.1 hypothetical protein XU18_2986 [Perkinsela sp. CCAP 1560/4]
MTLEAEGMCIPKGTCNELFNENTLSKLWRMVATKINAARAAESGQLPARRQAGFEMSPGARWDLSARLETRTKESNKCASTLRVCGALKGAH